MGELEERSKLVWSKGDYRPTSAQLRPASEALVAALGVSAGQQVLDVAAGDGNCAIAAARRGATVCASDFSPVMVESGRRRTASEGLSIEWREADATDLPFEAGAFDRVTSVFGIIFAPQQDRAASEAVRVTRAGGRIGITAWTPDGFTARMIQLMREFAPPMPADAPDPLRWGRPEEVERMFGALGCVTEVHPTAVTFRNASWPEFRNDLEAHGMAVVAKQTMPADRYQEMFARLERLVQEHNAATDDGIAVDADYLEIVATKP